MTMSLRDYMWINRAKTSNTKMAARLGITRHHFGRVVNGMTVPSVSLAKKIEKEIDGAVTWDEILDFCHTLVEAKLKNN